MITKEEIEAKTAEISKVKYELECMRQKYAEQQCPFKKGETVKNYGYDKRFENMVVTDIYPPKYHTQGDWEISGKAIKKDGKIGLQLLSFIEVTFKRKKECG